MMKKRLKWFFYFAAPLIVLIIPFSGGLNLSKYFKTIILQPKKTGITTLHYYDVVRNRPVITEVWYPVDPESPAKAPAGFWLRCDEARDAPLSNKKKQYPLIMMSHGSGGDRYNISWLAEVLSANGYIVAATDHFGNTWNNKIPESYARPWERPQDISFALNQLLNSLQFKDKIDQKRIGFAGYSLGGATGMWVAGGEAISMNSADVKANAARDLEDIATPELLDKIDFMEACGSYRDSRVAAVMVMAPALGWMFTENSLKNINIPVYIVAPEKDQVVPTEKNARVFAAKIAKATLKILRGEATHYVFLNRASAVGKRFLEPRYCEDPASINRKKLHDEIAKNSILFFDEMLK
jgi:predicted dienelactone hydrolase